MMKIWRGRVLWRGYVHPHNHPHTQLKKVKDSPYPYSYIINAGILRQNGDGFGQYPQIQIYLSSLFVTLFHCNKIRI